MPNKNILVLVDMQYGFTNTLEMERLVNKIHTLLSSKVFDIVIATQFFNADNSLYERLMWWSELKNIPDTNIRKELFPFVDDVVKKEIYTCVTPTFLQTLCHHNNNTLPEKVFVAGVDTDACVLKIATDLFEVGIRPIVLTEYCFSGGGGFYKMLQFCACDFCDRCVIILSLKDVHYPL